MSTIAASPLPPRFAALDGIRGWASLIVLLFHALAETNRRVVPELDSDLVSFLLDGHLAVYLFFILSGEALSASYLRTGDVGVVRRLAIRRYPRLTIPILLASALVWIAMVTGLDAHERAATALHTEWLAQFLQFPPSFAGFLGYALRNVYFDPPAALHYVPLLWTMRVELLGSCVVLGLLALLHGAAPRARIACLMAALALLVLFAQPLVGFILGMLLGEAHRHGWLDAARHPQRRRVVLVLALAMFLGMSGVRAVAHHDQEIRYILRDRISILFGPLVGGSNPLLQYADALGLFLVIRLTPPLNRFMSNGFSRFLGAISFPLYLVQFAVLITVTSWLSVWFVDPAAPSRAAIYPIAAATIAASLLLAWGFSFVERDLLGRTNAILDRIFEGRRPARIPPAPGPAAFAAAGDPASGV